MGHTLHKAASRGHANHGWLDTYHTFSFADYHDARRMHFGTIRVLNDDTVKGGRGFGNHPHSNMEIVSIPLSGTLVHSDSTGAQRAIRQGEVQIMSAGTGLQHSEYNPDPQLPVNFLQIWILPQKQDIDPRYSQKHFSLGGSSKNQWINVVAPDNTDALWINQQVWIYLAETEANQQMDYTLRSQKHGVYLFVIEGICEVENTPLEKRDGFGITEKASLQISTGEACKLLLMETLMHF